MIADAWTNLREDLPEETDQQKRAKNQLEILSAYMVNRELWALATDYKAEWWYNKYNL